MNGDLKNGSITKLSLPWHGWVLGGIFLLYSLAAAYDHVMSLSEGEIYFRACGMSESQIIYFSNLPLWASIGWALSVWGGLLGSLALLFRQGFSTALFFTALIGGLIYIVYAYFLSSGREAMGVLWPMPMIIAGITVGLIFYCRRFT